jgi:predicted TIM-barrel fold metal-dependent hydrolase
VKHPCVVIVLLVVIVACTSAPTATPVLPTAVSTQSLPSVTVTFAPTATSTVAPTFTATLAPTSAPTAIPVPTRTPTSAARGPIPLIDAHTQIEQTVDLNLVSRLIEQSGVSCVIMSTLFLRKNEDVVTFAAQHPGRIIPAVTVKGFGPAEWKKRIDTNQYGAMGEFLFYHAQKGDRAPLIKVYPDDPEAQVALRLAISQNWPFVVHIEFRSTGSERDRFMSGLETMLNRYPREPFVMIHIGELNLVEVQQLIQAHSNIYFMTSSTDPVFAKYGGPIWTNLFVSDHLAPGWKELMINHPDRFIFALDRNFPDMWSQMYLDEVAVWRRALDELPLAVAHAFAHGNAERLWHLRLIDASPAPTCSVNSN